MSDFVLVGGNKIRSVIDDEDNHRLQLIKHTDYSDSEYYIYISGIPIAIYNVPGVGYALGVYFAKSDHLLSSSQTTVFNGFRLPLKEFNDGSYAIVVDASASDDTYSHVVFNGIMIAIDSNRDMFVCDPYAAVEESGTLMLGGNRIKYVRMNGKNHIAVTALTDNGPSSGVLHTNHVE